MDGRALAQPELAGRDGDQDFAVAGAPVGIRRDPEELVARVQELTARLEAVDDDRVRTIAQDLLAALMELYGEGLERIGRALDEAGPAGAEIKRALIEDGVVGSLLLIHDLYPVDVETRVRQALDSVRPYMESHGGDVELLGIEAGVARLRLQGSCRGCPASSATLELAIKQAIEEAAPDLLRLEVEGMDEEADARLPGSGGDAFDLPVVNSVPALSGAPASWLWLEGVAGLSPGNVVRRDVSGADLIVANVNGTLYAYRNRCAGCGGPLHGGRLHGGALACPACARRFYLPRAGRSMDSDRLQLDPVPLLGDADAGVKVALA